jgi:hypothetical protein
MLRTVTTSVPFGLGKRAEERQFEKQISKRVFKFYLARLPRKGKLKKLEVKYDAKKNEKRNSS